jgi:molybdate-binding protein
LAAERFDLCFSAAALDSPASRAILDVLQRAALRKKLRVIAGYDTAQTGDVLM